MLHTTSICTEVQCIYASSGCLCYTQPVEFLFLYFNIALFDCFCSCTKGVKTGGVWGTGCWPRTSGWPRTSWRRFEGRGDPLTAGVRFVQGGHPGGRWTSSPLMLLVVETLTLSYCKVDVPLEVVCCGCWATTASCFLFGRQNFTNMAYVLNLYMPHFRRLPRQWWAPLPPKLRCTTCAWATGKWFRGLRQKTETSSGCLAVRTDPPKETNCLRRLKRC